MKEIYLVAGKKRSGKDAFATILKKQFESNHKSVEIMSFAAPMKDIIAITLGISLQELDDLKNNPAEPHRGYLQRFGTEGMKKYFGEDVWGRLMVSHINRSMADVIIIPDFRFPEEFRVLTDSWAGPIMTIKINRPSLQDDGDSHPSEHALDNFEFYKVINNNSDLAHLEDMATEMLLWS